jgi:hypothetical protein
MESATQSAWAVRSHHVSKSINLTGAGGARILGPQNANLAPWGGYTALFANETERYDTRKMDGEK